MMELDPAVQQFVDANAREVMGHLDVAGQRQYMRLLTDLNFLRFSDPGPDVHTVVEHTIPVTGGPIRCRIYRPNDEPRLPAHITLHGGGWWHGSIDDLICDALSRQRCAQARIVVIAVEYRLAPEHPFPTPVEDVHSAYLWAAEHAEELGVDRDNMSIGGSSAGANLAAAATIKLRDGNHKPPVLQLLEVPALDLTLATARHAAANIDGHDVRRELGLAVSRYLCDPGAAEASLASPLLAADLRGLPPAVVLTAEYDHLHEDGERYGTRLTEAGVPARVIRHSGALHGTAMLTRSWPPAAAWQQEAVAALQRAHWPERAGEPQEYPTDDAEAEARDLSGIVQNR
jgi:acetyl esterase